MQEISKIIKEHGTGKTTNLINLALERGGIIVSDDVPKIVSKMYRLGVTGIPVFSYEEFLESKNGETEKPVFVDNMERFTQFVIKGNFGGYTLSLD